MKNFNTSVHRMQNKKKTKKSDVNVIRLIASDNSNFKQLAKQIKPFKHQRIDLSSESCERETVCLNSGFRSRILLLYAKQDLRFRL